jgi:predicted RNA-binding protein with PIN domain
MAAARIWLMDGHNMIFAIHPLRKLQDSGRGEEARRGLVDRMRLFARTRGEKVLVVFDGIDLPSNPDVVREPFLEAVYAGRSEGMADGRIIHEARVGLERGRGVTVVTNDVSTLAGELPKGAQHLRVEAFWLKYIEPPADAAGKRVEGDFSDVEREMMRQAALAEPEPPSAGPIPPGRTAIRPAAPARPGARGRGAGREAMAEAIRRKRERGRLRQERRLKKRPKS